MIFLGGRPAGRSVGWLAGRSAARGNSDPYLEETRFARKKSKNAKKKRKKLRGGQHGVASGGAVSLPPFFAFFFLGFCFFWCLLFCFFWGGHFGIVFVYLVALTLSL